METPLRITFRCMTPSESVRTRIREHLTHLERFHGRMSHCHVVIEAPPTEDALFDVSITLALPGDAIFVTNDSTKLAAHADIYVALRDTFDTVKRTLQSHECNRCRAPLTNRVEARDPATQRK